MLKVRDEEKVSKFVKITNDGYTLMKRIQMMPNLNIPRARNGDIIYEALKVFEQTVLSRSRKTK